MATLGRAHALTHTHAHPTAQHDTAGGDRTQHSTAHHTTPHHNLSTPQLYPRAGCRVRSPGRQGPGTANRRCTNSVGCAHVPVPSTIPRDPAAPSTGRLGPGNGQRPPVEDGWPSLPLLSSPTRPPTHRAQTEAQTRTPPGGPALAPPTAAPPHAPLAPPPCAASSPRPLLPHPSQNPP